MTYLIVGNSLIQSTFTNNGAQSFEAMVYWPDLPATPSEKRNTLQHFWRDNSRPDRIWVGGVTFCDEARDAGSIIQASNGNFEVVVPREEGLVHYWQDNSTSALNWSNFTIVAEHSSGPGSIVENRENGQLEVVVRQSGGLRHFWRDGSGWHSGDLVTPAATGPACLIQSTYWNNLEFVVLEGHNLVHYWRDESETPILKWRFGGVITSNATGPAGFIQGRDGVSPNTNFHIVVPEGDRLVHYWRDNANGNLPWHWGGIVTHRAGPVSAASLALSDGLTPPSDYDLSLEVLLQENGSSIYHLYRYPEASGHRWFRGQSLRVSERDDGGIDADRTRPQSRRIAQLTGQHDAQKGVAAFNRLKNALAYGAQISEHRSATVAERISYSAMPIGLTASPRRFRALWTL